MKKAMSFVLALALVGSMAVPAAYAITKEDVDGGSATGSTTVSFTKKEDYTVTIPAAIELKDTSLQSDPVKQTISATNVCIAGNKQLTVTPTTLAKTMKTADLENAATLAYKLTVDGTDTDVEQGKAVLTVDGGTTSKDAVLNAWFEQAPTVAGTYSETVTFTVALAVKAGE